MLKHSFCFSVFGVWDSPLLDLLWLIFKSSSFSSEWKLFTLAICSFIFYLSVHLSSPLHFYTTNLLYCPRPFSTCFVQQKLWSFSSMKCHLLPVLHWLSCLCCVEYVQEEIWDLLNMNCCNKQSAEHLKQLTKSASVSGEIFRVRFFSLDVVKHCMFNLWVGFFSLDVVKHGTFNLCDSK